MLNGKVVFYTVRSMWMRFIPRVCQYSIVSYTALLCSALLISFCWCRVICEIWVLCALWCVLQADGDYSASTHLLIDYFFWSVLYLSTMLDWLFGNMDDPVLLSN